MSERLEIPDFLIAVSRMPEDKRRIRRAEWYESQKEHWIGWLYHYNSPGAYGRLTTSGRDARFVYNHVVNPGLLLYLAEASGVDPVVIRRAKRAAARAAGFPAQSGAIQRELPWSVVFEAMLRNGFVSSRAVSDRV